MKKIAKTFGIILAILLIIGLAIGITGYMAFDSMLEDMTANFIVEKDISLIVLKDSSILAMKDVKDTDIIGMQNICFQDSVQRMTEEMEKKTGFVNLQKEYESLHAMVSGLYSEDVPIVILDEAYREIVQLEFPEFDSETRVIFTIQYPQEQAKFVKQAEEVSKDTFTVLISGIDTYGEIKTISRSDVNILAVVNPTEAKVLLISIPRDYYVPIYSGINSIGRTDGNLDKLTHTGLFGPECTVRTLEKLFDTTINYYVRVNFTSLVDIVDAIGGITVNSDYAFDNFVVGENQCDGKRALEFSRERYQFKDGDRQRGRNQMKVIEAIVAKLTSPSAEYDYVQLFQAVKGSVQMNFSEEEVKKLIQYQLEQRPSWSVTSMSVNGSDARDYSYYGGQELYVMYPDQTTIDAAKAAIDGYLE